MTSPILAIDPGPVDSAYVILAGERIVESAKLLNPVLVGRFPRLGKLADSCIIERIASYGMPVGEEVFETCVWTGRFIQAWGIERVFRLPRKDVKLHLCNSPRANDAAIRTALIDRYGGREAAIGNKKAPGPLFGVAGDVWSALAVGLTFADKRALIVAPGAEDIRRGLRDVASKLD